MRRALSTFGFLGFLGLVCTGCMAGGLRVVDIGADTAKPANVQVLLAVEADKKPLAGLGRDNFAVFEDGIPIVSDAEVTVASPDMSPMQYTVLLLDWGGEFGGTPQADAVIDGATKLLQRLRPKQKLAVFAFDGAPDLHTVVAFSTPDAQAVASLAALRDFRARDTSSSLNGAAVAAGKLLQTEIAGNPMRGGSIVVVYHDPDRAGRVTPVDLDKAFKQPEYARLRRYAIGVGEDVKKAPIGPIGSTESVLVPSHADVPTQLDRIGEELASRGTSYYFVALCSRARAGQHEVRVDVSRKVTDEKGKESTQSASLRHKFSADGFGPGCKPKLPEELEALTAKPADKKDETAKKDDPKKDATKKDATKNEPKKDEPPKK
jgi:hypothetical protein